MKKKYLVLSVILVILDQLTKRQAAAVLGGGKTIPVIPEILELTYVENRGAAFGILQNRQWFFALITLAVLAGILWLAVRIPGTRRFLPLRLLCAVLAAGAAGNLIDRVSRGYVVDFIYFKPIDFPVFNVADIYVTVSAGALLLLLLFYYKDDDLEQITGKKSGSGK